MIQPQGGRTEGTAAAAAAAAAAAVAEEPVSLSDSRMHAAQGCVHRTRI